MFGSGTTTLIISNEEMNDIMKIWKSSFEESGLLIKGVRETFKKTKRRISWNVVWHFRCYFIGNLLTRKGLIRAGEGTIRAGQNFECCLIL